MDIKFQHQDANFAISDAELFAEKSNSERALESVLTKTGKGNDFLGWVTLPKEIKESEIADIEDCANRLRSKSDFVVVIGIGGSYLGARAVIEALQSSFSQYDSEKPKIVYAGNNMDEDYLYDLLQILDNRDYSLVVISKSGTTTEPAIAFRVLKQHCEKKYGINEAKDRIVAITDQKRGALKQLADKAGYQTFVIPDDVGGRYSVLTPVGLLPIAIAGCNIRELLRGAQDVEKFVSENRDFETNPVLRYAAMRNLLYKKGLKVELLTTFHPKLFYFVEWFKQLFGESEGKEGKGIFPVGAVFSTDLHSLGQYIQEGSRILFETVLEVENVHNRVEIPFDEENLDNLNYLQHRSIQEINQIARKGTCIAHVDGKVPNMTVSISEIDARHIGELIYFFEMSCAVSGYMLGVNPFDQPGVEAYKKNMFQLLGKPGF